MAVNPVKTANAVAISSMLETREDRQREQEKKQPSKNKRQANDVEARPEAAKIDSEAEASLDYQIQCQPIDTEKVIELLAQKKLPAASYAQIQKLSAKKVKKLVPKKIDKIY